MTEPLEFTEDGRGIVVGPDPDPQPRQALTLIVEFECTDGKTRRQAFPIPVGQYPRSMTLLSKLGEKDLGPILRSNFSIHEDSKQLHTICRRESDISSEEDEPPPGPEIDVLEY